MLPQPSTPERAEGGQVVYQYIPGSGRESRAAQNQRFGPKVRDETNIDASERVDRIEGTTSQSMFAEMVMSNTSTSSSLPWNALGRCGSRHSGRSHLE